MSAISEQHTDAVVQ